MHEIKVIITNMICDRVPTAQGKQGKWPTRFPVRENTGNLEILPKHREFWFAQVVILVCSSCKFPDSEGKRYFSICSKNFQFFLNVGSVCQVRFVYVIVTNHINWHSGNLRSDREKRENTLNLKMLIEWVP